MTLIFGSAWDYFAILTHIWGWPATCCILPRINGLPLEEVVFIGLFSLYVSTITLILRDVFLAHHWLKQKRRR